MNDDNEFYTSESASTEVVIYAPTEEEDAAQAILPLNTRIAIDFRAYFFRQFDEADKKKGSNKFFQLSTYQFDEFLHYKNYLPALPDNVINKEERIGLVQHRNRMRTYLNSASKKGLHGQPIFKVASHNKGKSLKVIIEEAYSAEIVPTCAANAITYLKNALKTLEKEHAAHMLLIKHYPVFAQDNIRHAHENAMDLTEVLVPVLSKVFEKSNKLKNATYTFLERERLEHMKEDDSNH